MAICILTISNYKRVKLNLKVYHDKYQENSHARRGKWRFAIYGAEGVCLAVPVDRNAGAI